MSQSLFVCTQLNSFKYYYLLFPLLNGSKVLLFYINNLFNNNNLKKKKKKKVLFDPLVGFLVPVMGMKEYTTFFKLLDGNLTIRCSLTLYPGH